MVDPINMTNYNLTRYGLEEYILFCIVVAGKDALTSARLLDELLKHAHQMKPVTDSWTPFEALRKFKTVGRLRAKMKSLGFGCHGLKSRGLYYMVHSGIDLKTCSWEDLDVCPGISLKTSKFFVLHTRKNAKVACLDTHILKWFTDIGYLNVPKVSPQSLRKYKMYEDIFLSIAKQRKMSPAKLDLAIWNEYRVKPKASSKRR